MAEDETDATPPDGLSAPGGEGAGARFAFDAPAGLEGATVNAFDSADKTTVRGPARSSGGAGGGGEGKPAALAPLLTRPAGPAAVSVVLGAGDAGGVPACVRALGARVEWAEWKGPRGGFAEVVHDALDSLARLEEVLARLGSSAGDDGAYQARVAEGLAHSLRDVLDELGVEADLSARGAWQVLLGG